MKFFRNILLVSFSLQFLVSILTSSDFYKSEIEFLFKSDEDFVHLIKEEESIKKYFHNFKETELSLSSGTKFKCYIPSKIKSSFSNYTQVNPIEKISLEQALMLTRPLYSLCYQASVREWFYKLCPFHHTQQTLSYMKRNENNEEYIEKFILGETKVKLNKTSQFVKFTNDNTTNLNKKQLISENFTSYVYTNDKIVKFFNFELENFKDTDNAITIYYNLNEVKDLNPLIRVNKERTLEEFLFSHPSAEEIPFTRKIVRLMGKNISLIDEKFPFEKESTNFIINKIGPKSRHDLDYSFNLNVIGNYIFCYRCEFLTYFSIGDSFFLKNFKYSDSLRSTFQGKTHQSRVIKEIINNEIIRVDKPFGKVFQASSLRNNYFVVDSSNFQYRWKCGKGYLKVFNNIVFGLNSEFLKELVVGDQIYLINILRNSIFYHQTSTNPKIIVNHTCTVKKIISMNLLITQESCFIPSDFKGTYLIVKNVKKTTDVTVKNITPLNSLKNPENKKQMLDFKKILRANKFKFFDQDFRPKEIKNRHLMTNSLENKINLKENQIFDEIAFSRLKLPFYTKNYITHKSLIFKQPQNSVLRFSLEKLISNYGYLRIILHTNIDTFYSDELLPQDYELIIHSDYGVAIKKLGENNSKDVDTFKFYETDIRSFFSTSIKLDIIFLDNSIYINSSDDNDESSIKMNFILPEGLMIKYISFDSKKSNNIQMKNIEIVNFVSENYFFNIYVFELRLKLGPNSIFIEKYDGGEYCDTIKAPRSSIIEYKCDETGNNDLIIDDVDEVNLCEYRYIVRSRFLCNPYLLMNNKINKSIAKTRCFAKNDQFYKNSEELFTSLL